MSSKHILIIGTGSVGKRHARNLSSLGCTISCIDPRQDRLDEAAQEITTLQEGYTSLEEAFAGGRRFDAVAVTSPPSFHIGQAVAALDKRIPVLLEKPVSPDLKSAQTLQKAVHASGIPLLLGYTWRWWPSLAKVRELLAQQIVGRLRYVKFIMSAQLADWHPWERYQDFFMASKTLGGGALLDESHWLDLMVWLFGMPQKLYAKVEKISDLQIKTDDNVDILCQYPENMRVYLHLDLYGRPHEKSIQFIGEKGTMIWEPERIRIGHGMEPEWQIENFSHDRNDMFLSVAREFLDVLGGRPVTTCNIDDGIRVLTLVEAARCSSSEEKTISIET
jgi:predicted dehydrogenase